MKTLSATLYLTLLAAGIALAGPSGNCPPQGDASKGRIRDLNELMARTDSPSDEDVDDSVTMEELVEPGQDDKRFENGTAVVVSGYVAAIHDGGPSSSNCHSEKPEDQDTVLELALDSTLPDTSHRAFAVVTPRWRAIMARQKQDWSTRGLRARYLNRWVTVAGWLLFDFEAAPRARNTAPAPGAGMARATAWEIHPVTAIDLDEDFPEEQTALVLAAR